MKLKCLMICLLCILIFSGCSINDNTSKYYKAANEFNKIYFDTAKTYDILNDKILLERIESAENISNINKLKMLLLEILSNIPDNRKIMKQNFINRLDELIYLNENFSLYVNSFETIDFATRSKVSDTLSSIYMNLSEKEENNIIWQ